jgi:hypothetical protein
MTFRYEPWAVNPTPNPELVGPGLRTCDPWKQGDPTIPSGTGFSF